MKYQSELPDDTQACGGKITADMHIGRGMPQTGVYTCMASFIKSEMAARKNTRRYPLFVWMKP